MRTTIIAALITAGLAGASPAAAQNAPAQATATSAPSLSKSLGLYVFPAKNQSTQQQDADEAACYNWAMQQTGVNPMGPAPSADSAAKAWEAKAKGETQGAAVVGGAKGAAAGTAIGAIAGNTGEGAAIGAVVGGLAAHRQRKELEQEAAIYGAQAAKQKQQQQDAAFAKAMTACLEAKGYSVN